jgi:hypothetical protein
VSLGAWVRAKGKVEDAVDRLHQLPPSKSGKGVRVPFPYVSRDSYKSQFSNEEINHLIVSAPRKSVPLSTLHAIQHSVRADRVKEYIKYPEVVPEGAKHALAHTPVDVPIVIHHNGVNLLHDGHHRATASQLSGEKTIEARYIDLDAVVKV